MTVLAALIVAFLVLAPIIHMWRRDVKRDSLAAADPSILSPEEARREFEIRIANESYLAGTLTFEKFEAALDRAWNPPPQKPLNPSPIFDRIVTTTTTTPVGVVPPYRFAVGEEGTSFSLAPLRDPGKPVTS